MKTGPEPFGSSHGHAHAADAAGGADADSHRESTVLYSFFSPTEIKAYMQTRGSYDESAWKT